MANTTPPPGPELDATSHMPSDAAMAVAEAVLLTIHKAVCAALVNNPALMDGSTEYLAFKIDDCLAALASVDAGTSPKEPT